MVSSLLHTAEVSTDGPNYACFRRLLGTTLLSLSKSIGVQVLLCCKFASSSAKMGVPDVTTQGSTSISGSTHIGFLCDALRGLVSKHPQATQQALVQLQQYLADVSPGTLPHHVKHMHTLLFARVRPNAFRSLVHQVASELMPFSGIHIDCCQPGRSEAPSSAPDGMHYTPHHHRDVTAGAIPMHDSPLVQMSALSISLD